VVIPVEPTVAIPVALELHTPPEVALPSVMFAPAHTDDAPVMVPAFGSGFTVIDLVADTLPQLLVTMYEIIAVPAATPVVIPVEPTVAIPMALELHTPPVVALLRAIVAAAHTADAPVIVPALGNGFTVIVLVARQPVDKV
jgi:hypothetical protein